MLLDDRTVVGVVGAGQMGAGIAQVAAAAGHRVLLHDMAPGAAENARRSIASALAALADKGKLDRDAADALVARIEPVAALDGLAPAGLVIEVVVERLDAKVALLRAIEDIVAPTAILASNTSSLSITAMAAPLLRPARVAGFHFFNPAPRMPLVEVIAGLATGEEVVDALTALARRWGKEPVRVRSTPGFIVNRVARSFYGEALLALQQGAADPATLDAVMREAGGFRMGPCELMDLIGHDVNFAVSQSVFDAFHGEPRFRPSLVQRALVDAGWLGRKRGRGVFDHREGAAPAKPEACAASGDRPAAVTILGELGPAEPLVDMIRSAGVAVVRGAGEGEMRVGRTRLGLTDGRSLTARAADGEDVRDLALLDLALDYRTCPGLAVATMDGADAALLADAASLFGALGKTLRPVGDIPGLIVARTVATIVNEAAEAWLHGVATPEDIDKAMRLGVNYPLGPFEWAGQLGWPWVRRLLMAMGSETRDERYRPSRGLLRRAVAPSVAGAVRPRQVGGQPEAVLGVDQVVEDVPEGVELFR